MPLGLLSGEVGAHAWQGKKRITIIMSYHKVELYHTIKIMPVSVCDYSGSMAGAYVSEDLFPNFF
jgi:hypothetical protein